MLFQLVVWVFFPRSSPRATAAPPAVKGESIMRTASALDLFFWLMHLSSMAGCLASVTSCHLLHRFCLSVGLSSNKICMLMHASSMVLHGSHFRGSEPGPWPSQRSTSWDGPVKGCTGKIWKDKMRDTACKWICPVHVQIVVHSCPLKHWNVSCWCRPGWTHGGSERWA